MLVIVTIIMMILSNFLCMTMVGQTAGSFVLVSLAKKVILLFWCTFWSHKPTGHDRNLGYYKTCIGWAISRLINCDTIHTNVGTIYNGLINFRMPSKKWAYGNLRPSVLALLLINDLTEQMIQY